MPRSRDFRFNNVRSRRFLNEIIHATGNTHLPECGVALLREKHGFGVLAYDLHAESIVRKDNDILDVLEILREQLRRLPTDNVDRDIRLRGQFPDLREQFDIRIRLGQQVRRMLEEHARKPEHEDRVLRVLRLIDKILQIDLKVLRCRSLINLRNILAVNRIPLLVDHHLSMLR